MEKCEIKITPQKENDIAVIELVLKGSATWNKLTEHVQNILKDILASVIHKEVSHNNTFTITIEYQQLEFVSKKIDVYIALNPFIEIIQKQIYIKKLGGWFDV